MTALRVLPSALASASASRARSGGSEIVFLTAAPTGGSWRRYEEIIPRAASGQNRGLTPTAGALRVEQRDVLVVGRLRERLQVGVDVGEVLVRQDRLRVRRHCAFGVAHEDIERLVRHRARGELRAGHASLRREAVALPAAVLHVGGLAFLRGAGGEP